MSKKVEPVNGQRFNQLQKLAIKLFRLDRVEEAIRWRDVHPVEVERYRMSKGDIAEWNHYAMSGADGGV